MDPTDPRLQCILATVDMIPAGSVATYGQIAREAGLPGRARLVGFVLGQLPRGTQLPWHRVVAASGMVSPRPDGGHAEQSRRLEREGVMRHGRRIAMDRFRWRP